jgi:hypothetical protein
MTSFLTTHQILAQKRMLKKALAKNFHNKSKKSIAIKLKILSENRRKSNKFN